MKTIRIFPDYCSSGIWCEHGNMDVSQINIDDITKVALCCWHWMWEKWELDLGLHAVPSKKWLEDVYTQWWEDGAVIAYEIQKQNPELLVVYDADKPEDLIEYYHKVDYYRRTVEDCKLRFNGYAEFNSLEKPMIQNEY